MSKKRKLIKKSLYLLLVVGLLAFGIFSASLFDQSNRTNESSSIELGYASPSPNGPENGFLIPASCESGAGEGGVQHWFGDSFGSCPAATCSPSLGSSCTGPLNVCGSYHYGTVQCDGSCTARRPQDPPSYGTPCNSAPNNCGRVNSGTIDCGNNQDGTHCSAPAPGDDILPCGSPQALRICPITLTVGMGTVYQMRAFYLIGGVDCSSTGPATDVTNLVTWTSSSPSIATVGNNPTGGRINTQFTVGTTSITISSYAGETAAASSVTVIGGYAICPASASTFSGGTTPLRAYHSALTLVNCSNLVGTTDVTGSVTWFTSNSTVATVSAGLVTGVSGGSTSISVSPYNGAIAVPATVTISGGYRICPASAIVGSSGFSFRSYYNPSGPVNCSNLAGTSDVTGSVTWSSSSPGVATVGNGASAGVTTAVSVGSSNISTTPYAGIPSGSAIATVTCIPSVSCSSAGPTATAANTCPSQTFTIDDGCGFVITCSGTRTCDFNWKEVSQ